MIDDILHVKSLKTWFNYLHSFPIYKPYNETIFFSLFLVYFNQNSSTLRQNFRKQENTYDNSVQSIVMLINGLQSFGLILLEIKLQCNIFMTNLECPVRRRHFYVFSNDQKKMNIAYNTKSIYLSQLEVYLNKTNQVQNH